MKGMLLVTNHRMSELIRQFIDRFKISYSITQPWFQTRFVAYKMNADVWLPCAK